MNLFDQTIWGNKLLTVQGHTLFSKSFIDSKINKIGDVFHANGALKDNLYHKLQNKHQYFRIVNLIIKSVRPYKQYRFSEESLNISHEVSFHLDVTKIGSKYFYDNLINKKAKPLPNLETWSAQFGNVIWDNVYQQKIKNQPESKYAEFNFKIVSGILATNSKLFKWKKSEIKSCIYCQCDEHTAQHLLSSCQHVHLLWDKLTRYFDIVITWEIIVTGKALTLPKNIIVTMICYVIYKKFIVDRNNQVKEELVNYTLKQLKYIGANYSYISSKRSLAMDVNDVIEVIEK